MGKAKDLKGFKNENWEVLERIGTKGHYATWKCKCKCGNEKIICSRDVFRTKYCDVCIHVDKTGRKYGKWTVIEKKGTHKNGGTQWLCECHCGEKRIISGGSLASGTSKSCGCSTVYEFFTPIYRKFERLEFKGASQVFIVYKKEAKKREIAFELSNDCFYQLLKGNCEYCGCEPSNIRIFKKSKRYKQQKFYYNGIDRRDSSHGYIMENCVSCCWRCNSMKNKFSENEFYDHMIKILRYKGLTL